LEPFVKLYFRVLKRSADESIVTNRSSITQKKVFFLITSHFVKFSSEAVETLVIVFIPIILGCFLLSAFV